MLTSIRSEFLLRQADDLAGRYAGAGKPRNADLRRAVSAAYYALFHHLTLMTAEQMLPNGSLNQHYQLTRQFNHNEIKTVCERVLQPLGSGPQHQTHILDAARQNQDIQDIAATFIDLQQARHEADYDHLASFTRPATLTYINSANDAIGKLDTLWGGTDLEAFLALIMVSAKAR